MLCLAIVVQFMPAYLAPRFALERAQVAEWVYERLNASGRDPWGNHFRWYGWWRSTARYSCGPNGLDEKGLGDDLKLRPLEEFSAPWIACLFLLWCLPGLLCAAGWVLVVRVARRAHDRSLGWRELGWALVTGGPLAAFAAGYGWWGSDNRAWRDLMAGQGGLVGWRLSLTGSVVAALFVAGWALSRPPRRAEGWAEDAGEPEPSEPERLAGEAP
jgi:hypothetical protein